MTRRRTSLTVVAAVGALLAAGATAAPAQSATQSATQKRLIARTAPTWVAHAKSTGTAPASGRSTFKVYLAPNGGVNALKADVAEISTPGSATYRHFLTSSQYHARYDATSASAAKVAGWLRSNHLSVTSTEAHRRYLSVSGSNAAVAKAFSTSIKKFRHHGQSVQANTTAVAMPADIAALVTTVTGLDTTPSIVRHHARVAPGFRNARPCSRFYGQLKASTKADYKTPLPTFQGKVLPYAVCGYTGPQLRAAYEDNSALDGTGVKVAITDAYASPTIASDAQQYATSHGDGGYAAGQLTQSVPGSFKRGSACNQTGWYGEETLDVEAVHAMAPGAKILYYASASCFDDDFLATLARVVDDNQASLVSNSWGDVEQNETTEQVAAYEGVFLQGAMQGVGFLFSSGDGGDELSNSGLKQADYPTSDPYVTSVGGTSDAIGASGQFLFQTGWGTVKYTLSANGKSWTSVGFTSGAGGGFSALFQRPDYQQGVVTGGSGRAVPDVGLDADPTTGFLVGQTQSFPEGKHYDEFRIGGTSLASPLFAGMTALRQQAAGTARSDRLGFLNPSIYDHISSFKDVKGQPRDAGNVRADFANGVDATDGILYSVRAFNRDSSLAVTRGWDDVTGVGSPTPAWITAD